VQFDEAMSHARPYPDARFDCVISSLFGDSETCNTGEQRHAADGYGCAAAYAERSPSLVKEWLMLKHVKFSELAVEDQDRAIAFYTEKVGFEVAQDSPYKEGWRWVELAIPGADTRVLLTKQPDNYEKGLPRLVLVTDDVEKTYEELTSKGVRFQKAPTQAPWNPGETFAQFEDSEGNGVVLGSE
jgi:lactoylglutathione lyase